MPYIQQENRDFLDPIINEILETISVCNVGDMNYIITKLIHQWVETHGGLGYATTSRARAILSDANDEFYRVVMAPYEDKKRRENGCISKLDELCAG